ncbi:GNAT family N-acetyltransferase [Catenulispora yoronensis]
MPANSPSTSAALEVHHTSVSDPAAEPLRAGLLDEYVTRYGDGAIEEMKRFPDALFTPEEGGAFLLLVENGVTVAGGAYKRYNAETAEFKRIWTHADHRRRGLARRVLTELEDTARSAATVASS